MHSSKPPFYKGTLLADLVDMDSPQAVLDEVLLITTLIHPQMDPTLLTNAFGFMVSLYQGKWPGERGCNTQFHDLRHITDTLLAMARLIHGATLSGHAIRPRDTFVSMVGAMVHDTGYIQDKLDADGTGAKYTSIHVERSMAFVARYGCRYGLTAEEIPACQIMIQCTDLDTDITILQFPSPKVELLGKLLGCADLIGQMADRIYLEKLFYLYREFEEGMASRYSNEMDLLKQTLDFFPMIQRRINQQLGGYDKLARLHFNRRWGMPKNLYQVAIEKQHQYLEHILAHPDRHPGEFLRRKEIVEKLIKAGPR